MRSRLLIAQTLHAATILVRDERIPRPLRWGGAFGLLPLPGPLDEAVLIVVAALLWLFYRDRFREAWDTAEPRASERQLQRERKSARRSSARGWIRAAMLGLLIALAAVVAAKVIGRWYYDPAVWALAGWSVPPDFSDFYLAAEAVLSGDSPYRVGVPEGWLGYVYPPLLAWLMAPLTLISVPVAVSLWAALSVLFVVGALWILGVRDWRCYPIALLWPFNREAIEFGAIDGLLVLVVAACWRYRDVPFRASAATGVAVALKLFLWPLGLWLGLSGRLRAASLSVLATALLVFLPWALIGFQDLDRYPALLREVSAQQSGSYSLASLGETVGVAANFAQVVSVALAAVLLFLAYRAANEHDQTALARDGRSFTLTLAAALAATPIVWNHYFLLLLVPVAIARPRLSGLWFIPLSLSALYVFDWYGPRPEGRAPLIATTAIATLVIVLSLELQSGSIRTTAGHFLRRVRDGRTLRRRVAPILALGAFLVLVFVAVPEKLNDWPYNPLGRDTSTTLEPNRREGDSSGR